MQRFNANNEPVVSVQIWLVRSVGVPFVAHRSNVNTGVTLWINPAAGGTVDVAIR